MVCHSASVQRALHRRVNPDFVWVWIPIFKNYPKYMERKVLLASPHLKVQITPYLVRSTFDGSMCRQLLQGDNTHLNDTGTFPSAISRRAGALLCSLVNTAVFVTTQTPAKRWTQRMHFF